ncbi:hypothetical protein ACYSNM_13190 [Myroides sp. LJL116]
MIYSKLKNLINNNPQNLYIGKGNPDSSILFIGKEAAINQITNKEAYLREVKNNNDQWIKNISDQITQEDVANWSPNYLEEDYNPLYPYKGQLNKIESRNKQRDIIRGEGGSSSTWCKYQKIIDSIFNCNKKSDYINFHEKAFITEFSDESAQYSKDTNKKNRQQSLTQRQEFLRDDFYQSFPVVIIAAGHYVRDHKINIEKIFNVKYQKMISIGKTNYINIHFDDLENPKKLVIHTNQLSMGVSRDLIEELAKQITQFMSH